MAIDMHSGGLADQNSSTHALLLLYIHFDFQLDQSTQFTHYHLLLALLYSYHSKPDNCQAVMHFL